MQHFKDVYQLEGRQRRTAPLTDLKNMGSTEGLNQPSQQSVKNEGLIPAFKFVKSVSKETENNLFAMSVGQEVHSLSCSYWRFLNTG